MHHLAVALHLLGLRLQDRAAEVTGTHATTLHGRTRRGVRSDGEQGSVTIEQVIWAVAMIAIAGGVVVVIRAFVTTQAGKIQ